MTLESQVCSLDLAKRLKELKVKQESAFYYVKNPSGNMSLYQRPNPTWESVESYWSKDCWAAFTVAELGEMLKMTHGNVLPFFDTSTGDWFYIDVYAETEADARAKMLIYLIEQRIIKP